MVTDELTQLQAVQHLPPDLMLLKMENEQMFSVARMQPRDDAKIVQRLQALVDAYPAAADEAVYCKPVGSVFKVQCEKCNHTYEMPKLKDFYCPRCKHDRIIFDPQPRKIKKYAENLSIRAAETVRSIFGFNRLETSMTLLPDGRAEISGVFVDFAACNVTMDKRIVSPHYKSSEGQMMTVSEDRFLNLTVKAEKSKLARDIILDSVPNIIKAAFRDMCEKKALECLTPEKMDQIVAKFGTVGITLEHLEKIVGQAKALGWTEQHRSELHKLWNAIKNEETTVAEILEDLEGVPAETQAKPKRAREVPFEPKAGPPFEAKPNSNGGNANWRTDPELPSGAVQTFELCDTAEKVDNTVRLGMEMLPEGLSAEQFKKKEAALKRAGEGRKAELAKEKSPRAKQGSLAE